MGTEYAVIVRNAQKRYSSQQRILDGLNLTVKKGTIYGLLGASGCGKTTLLSCVVGVRKLDEGDIWVLGGRPGTPGSGIPGPRVGYMPQEISLCQEFTVLGALYYFGRISNMEDYDIEDRYNFLMDLLQLPPKDRLIKDMSGGQQRRVSFAAALIHRPELLILDEPTVGLDPVLRDNIWNYLMKLTVEEKITVIITTHYIEEARQAHTIGLLRRGTLLSESSPTELLQKYQTDSLEEAFLSSSQAQEGDIRSSTSVHCPNLNLTSASYSYGQNNNTQGQYKSDGTSYTVRKMKALITKNIMQFLRNPSEVAFAIILPLMQLLIFFPSIGGDPKGLKIYVVNEEAGNCTNLMNYGNISYDELDYACNFKDLSCRFINGFGDSIVEQVFWDDIEDAKGRIKESQYVGAMHYSRNFSQALESRLEDLARSPNEDILASEISVWLDMGDRQIGLFMQRKLHEQFLTIFEDILSECRIPTKVGGVPLRYETPIFGDYDQNYGEAIAPTFLLTVVFFLATAVCSSIIIADRHDGVWDRSLVQGVRTVEILISHLTTQMLIVFIQVGVTLLVAFGIFDLECKGSFPAAIIMVLLNSVAGMCYGFLISVSCSSHTVSNFISTGSFYPVILLCGCIWPIEGMPKFLKYISMTLPTTVPGISLRSIMVKGYTIQESETYSGFLVTLAWIVGVFSICLFQLRSHKPVYHSGFSDFLVLDTIIALALVYTSASRKVQDAQLRMRTRKRAFLTTCGAGVITVPVGVLNFLSHLIVR